MLYWDGNGAWTINTQGRDLGNTTLVYNTTASFTYNLLKALVISPISLTWPSVSLGATNQTSNNDPTIINNTGNYNATGKIAVNALNLHGETNALEFISAANFTIDIDTGGSPPAECNGTAMVITKNVIRPGREEVRGNSRARSAKLRIFEKV